MGSPKGPQAPQGTLAAQGGIQNNLAGLANLYGGNALGPINSATDYYQALLKGGPTAQAAVAPMAQQVGQAYQGAQKTIENTAPIGGERNLAMTMLPIQRAGSIASLYQGLGPAAAQGLSGLGLGQLQQVPWLGNAATGAGSSLIGYQAQQNQQKGQSLGGVGAGLGSIAGGYLGGPAMAKKK